MAPGTPTLGQQMISPRHSRFSPLCFLPSSSSLLKPSLPRTKPAGMKNSGMEEEAGLSGLGQQQQQQEVGCRVQGFKVLKGQSAWPKRHLSGHPGKEVLSSASTTQENGGTWGRLGTALAATGRGRSSWELRAQPPGLLLCDTEPVFKAMSPCRWLKGIRQRTASWEDIKYLVMLCEEHIEKQKEIDLGLVVPLANEEKVPLRLEGSRCWHSHTAQQGLVYWLTPLDICTGHSQHTCVGFSPATRTD